MSAEEPGASRVKRMLPSVSEVLKELTARAQVEPDVAFRAAREVCAEELKRIRDIGGDSVPIEELVQRAYQRATGAYSQSTGPIPPRLPVPPPPPAASAPAAPPQARVAEDPFSETAGAMDLRWDREGREPFTEPQAGAPAGAAAQPEAFGAGPVPSPPPPALPIEPTVTVPSPFAPSAFEPAVPVAEPEAPEGPGDETLGRLSREAEAIDLRSALRGAREEGGLAMPSPPPADASPAPAAAVPTPFEDEEETVLTIPRGGRTRDAGEGGSRTGIVAGVAIGLVALAALGYLLVGLWLERDTVPAPVAVARPRPSRPPLPVASPAGGRLAPAAAPSPAATGAAPSKASSPAAAPAAAVPAPSAAPAATAIPRVPAPAAVPSAAPLTIARPTPGMPKPSPAPTTAPAAIARVEPKPATVPAAPTAAATATAPVRQSKDGLVVTRDRAGQPQVFSIHFTSYKDRAAAERDLKRIEGLVGRPGFVAEVDLGEKGIWQRVMIGTFATAQEAKAAREELAAKGTRDLGWVYRVVGP